VPLPVQKSIPLPATGGALTAAGKTQGKQSVAGRPLGKKPGGKNDLFGPDPGGNDSFAGLPMTTPAPAIIPPAAPAQPVMPQAGYAPQQIAPNPYAPQAYPQQPMFPQQPMYPQLPMYPQQPMYPMYPAYPQQPVYQQPMYQAPPYGGYAAPPPQYGAMPAADPYGGYLGPPPEAPISSAPPYVDVAPSAKDSGMPPPPILPGEVPSRNNAKASKSASEKCGFLNILPFGSGQFCNGSTMKGVFFLGAEIGALYFYKSNNDAAATYQSKLNSILAERETARADVPADEQVAYDAETADKEAQGKATIAKAKQNAQYSMFAFVGLWGVGAIDASFNAPSAKIPKKSKRKSPRIMHSYNLDLEKAPMGTWAMSMPYETTWDSSLVSQDYMVGYTPTLDKNGSQLQHSLTLGMIWEL
jgi:hypothetical protein